jgi:hypothetical protein
MPALLLRSLLREALSRKQKEFYPNFLGFAVDREHRFTWGPGPPLET